MFLKYIVRPIFIEPFEGLFSHLYLKLALIISGIPGLLALDLFETPELWWKGLVWLVVLDWVGGAFRAAYTKEFNLKILPRKWYQVVGYMIVCGAAAIISNGLTSELEKGSLMYTLFYGFQFVVYITFFMKEFFSILRTWKVITAFLLVYEIVKNKEASVEDLEEFREEVDRRWNQKETETEI